MELYDWSKTAGGNNSAPPDGAPENMFRSLVNDVIREVMAVVRRWYEDPQWVNPAEGYTVSRIATNQFRIAGVDMAALFPVDRRVKVSDVGTASVEGFVNTSSYTGGNTDVTVDTDGGVNLEVGTDRVEMHAIPLGRAAYRNVGTATTQVIDGTNLSGSISANISAASGALKDYAASFGEADKMPLYDQLGTAASKDHGTGAGDVPTNADLPTTHPHPSPPAYSYTELSADYTTTSAARNGITGLIGLTFPGTPNGSKRYRVIAGIYCDNTSASAWNRTELPQMHMGTLGDHTDNVVQQPNDEDGIGASDQKPIYLIRVLQPGATDKLTISVDTNGSTAKIIKGILTTKPTFVEIQEILT